MSVLEAQDDDSYHAEDGPAEHCVFCENPVPAEGAEAEIFLMSDYVSANFGEQTPGRRVGLCGRHAQLLRERVPTQTELLIQDE